MKAIASGLIMALLFTSSGLAQAGPGNRSNASPTKTSHIAKIKAAVQQAGTSGRVRVTLREPPAEISGAINAIRDDDFDVAREKTGEVVAVPYSNVEKLRGPGLSKGAKIAIAVGIVVVAVAVIAAIVVSHAKGPNVML